MHLQNVGIGLSGGGCLAERPSHNRLSVYVAAQRATKIYDDGDDDDGDDDDDDDAADDGGDDDGDVSLSGILLAGCRRKRACVVATLVGAGQMLGVAIREHRRLPAALGEQRWRCRRLRVVNDLMRLSLPACQCECNGYRREAQVSYS
jgi:hypothetical protein